MDRARLIDGIRTDAAALLSVLRAAPDDAFGLPTPCAAWEVAHLVAHLHRDFERVGWALASTTDDPPDRDRITYWHYDRAENQATTQQRAIATVSQFETPAALVDALDAMVAEALALAADAPGRGLGAGGLGAGGLGAGGLGASGAGAGGLDAGGLDAGGLGAGAVNVQLTWGPVMDFDEFLATRWLELVVHSLDLTTALGVADCVSDEGVALVVDILDGLAGRTVSADWAGAGWSAPAFIRAATGRTPLAPEARARLGTELADRFPLLA